MKLTRQQIQSLSFGLESNKRNYKLKPKKKTYNKKTIK